MKKILFILLFLPLFMTGQSTDKNYVLTKTYTDATTGTITQDDIITTVQYYDGLGRPIQTINFEAGGAHQDIITPVVYDDGGKVTKNYLPYANPNSSTGSLNYGDNSSLIYTQQNRYYAKYPNDFTSLANTNAYSETFYDNSPLNRVLKQGAPGTAWKGNTNDDNDHTIKKVYTANQLNEVYHFAVSFSGSNTEQTRLEIVGYYNPEELYKTITKDENWTSGVNNTVEEFKDKEGRVVLTRKYNNNKTHDTYYVYDKFSNLTYVIPPLAVDDIISGTPTSGTIKTEVVDGLCYIYHYDYRNRVIEKKIPGKGWDYMVYDRLDRVIMSQDDKMRSADGGYLWFFTKYDIYDRVVYTGTLKRTSSRSIIQNEFNAISHPNMNEVRTTSAFSGNGVSVYYTNQAYPYTTTGTNYTVNTINYYDSYSNIGVSAPPSTVYGETVTTVVKSLPVVTWVRVIDESNPNKYIRTTNGYDKKARLIYSYVNDTYSQYTQTTLLDLDFTGKVLKQKTTHVKQINGQPQSKVVVDYYTYDHMGRVLKHTQNGSEADSNRELIASNTYDELGVLVKKGVGGNQLASLPLQTVDYAFTVRGWLKSINNPDAKLTDDLFAFKINYNDPTLGSTSLYNGNISETFWKSRSDGKLRSYSYKYDHLNRLTDAKYTQQHYLVSNPSQLEDYTEGAIEYDKNGNIITLTRYGMYDDHNVDMIGKIDVLNYTYKPFSNTLIAVEDQGPSEGFNNGDSSSEEYLYDVNGNMTIDTNKKIIKTNYNYLNQPTEVAFSNNAIIYYIYTATGTKLKKIVRQPDGTAVETEYNGGFIYEKQHSGTNTFQYFATTEGYAVKSADPKKSFDYIYQYKDHLGNVRLSYKDVDGNGAISNAEIVEQSNYYAFGLQHKGYNTTVTPYGNAVAQKWKYNDIEFEEALGYNMYEMEARQYDPAIARWVVIDPVVHHSMSPYNAFDNNPVFWADPSGADGVPGYLAAMWNATASGTNSAWYNNNDGSFSSDFGLVLDSGTLDMYTVDQTLPNLTINGYLTPRGIGLGELSSTFANHVFRNADIYSYIRDAYWKNQIHEALDIVGYVDPTGIADGINAGLYAAEGNYAMAAISAAAILPLGDLAKGLKITNKKQKYLKFAGDGAVEHFAKHGNSVMQVLEQSSYNLKNYMDDANYIINNGKFIREMNGYVKFIGGTGTAKYGFVGLNRIDGTITTFHIKNVGELARKAPSKFGH